MRHAKYREKKYSQGLRQVSFWVPAPLLQEVKLLRREDEKMNDVYMRLLRDAVEREKRKKIIREKTKTGWW